MATKRNILVVDDNPLNRKILNRILLSEGYHVTEAENGQEALHILTEIEDEAKAAGADMFISKPLFQSTVCNVLMTLSKGKYTQRTADESDYDLSGKRVLLVEDNALNQEIAVELLEMVHLKVECADDGQSALNMFEKSVPGYYDIILMDIQLPIMDGYESTSAIRSSSHPQAHSIPIYAMTANAFSEDIAAA